jgi:hypothetical protein
MEERKGLGEVERKPPTSATQHTSPRALCFRLARQRFGEDGATLIGQALREGVPPEAVLAEMELIEPGDRDTLAHSLYHMAHYG